MIDILPKHEPRREEPRAGSPSVPTSVIRRPAEASVAVLSVALSGRPREAPIRMPVASTMTPPSTIWKIALSIGVSM